MTYLPSNAMIPRMSGIISVALLLLLVLSVSSGSYYFWRSINQPIALNDVIFTIERGQSLRQVAQNLVDHGVILEPYSLRLLARWRRSGHNIRHGEYRFPSGINLDQLLTRIVAGKGQVYSSITFIEGWNFKQIRSSLQQTLKLKQTLAGLDDGAVMARLDHPGEHPEGRFYPDTYHYKKGDTDLSILEQAYQLMAENLALAWSRRSATSLLTDPYQALIMASIIEKETQQGDERGLISGVFNNRLRKGMKLQTDPTVIYGVGKSFDGNLTRKHLRTDTQYNTYTRTGLPPTPIAMPQLASLQAAVNPTATKAIFFVAKGGGKHHFSATYTEHNRAVNRYQR